MIKFKFSVPLPKFMQSRYYGYYLQGLGVILMLAELLLASLAFIAQSWIPAAICIGGLMLSVMLQRIGDGATKRAIIHMATMEGYKELDKRNKSRYN
jgi:hypothetical protein